MVVYLFNFNTCQDLALLEIGDQQCSPLYAFGPNIRNEYIFHYVVSGKGVVMLQPSGEKGQNILSETIEVKAGEGFLLEPHTAHMYRADENDPWHYIWIVFTGLSVPSYLRACGLTIALTPRISRIVTLAPAGTGVPSFVRAVHSLPSTRTAPVSDRLSIGSVTTTL